MRRRRAASVGTGAAAAVVAIALAVTTLSPGGSGQLATGPSPFDPTKLPSGILLSAGDGRVVRLPDLDAKSAATVPGLKLQTGDRLQGAVGTGADGRSIIAQDGARDFVVIDPVHPERSRVLLANEGAKGRATAYDIPGLGRRQGVLPFLARGGALWVWVGQIYGNTKDHVTRGTQLVPMDLDGQLTGRPIDLPPITWVVTVGREGAYVLTTDNRLALVSRDGSVHRLSVGGAAIWSDAGYGRVFWDAVDECSSGGGGADVPDTCHYELLDAETGKVHELTARPSQGSFGGAPVWSPDGRYLAITLIPSGLPLIAGKGSGGGYAVVDTATDKVTVVRASLRYYSDPNITAIWSGDRLIWSGTLDARHSLVGAYLPATGKSATTTVPVTSLRVLGAAG
jgi:hypothetical protein